MRTTAGISYGSLLVSVGFAIWAGNALAATPTPTAISTISNEFWLGLLFSVLFALLGGYAKGLDSRVKALEHEQRQQASAISLIRETTAREHPTKHETAEHRRYVEEQLLHIRQRLDTLAMTR